MLSKEAQQAVGEVSIHGLCATAGAPYGPTVDEGPPAGVVNSGF